ncbi:MAG: sugar-transfer associated ATP-grasp domain-containing protein [Candidatus Krumholzibacteriales bacterium]
MVTILKKINRLIRKIWARIAGLAPVIRMFRDPVWSKTRYPGEELKSRPRILLENIFWLLRHGEVNRFYWLYGFDRADGPGHSEYMPYTRFKKIRNQRNRIAGIGGYYSDYTVILKDKFVFSLVLSSLGFSTPKVAGVCMNGRINWLDTETETGLEGLKNLEDINYFCKTLLGECADGVCHLTGGAGSLLCDGRAVDISELQRMTSGSFLLQERVEQHPEMSRLYPCSINTIRLVTVMTGGAPQLFAASIRTGASGSTRDNWAVGGLSGGIDIETGKLSPIFDFKPGYGGRADRHPDTGVIFGEFTVPMFDQAKKEALELHSYLYGLHSIGWDMAISPDGPVFIEGNDNWEITPHQVVEGGLRRRFLEAAGLAAADKAAADSPPGVKPAAPVCSSV